MFKKGLEILVLCVATGVFATPVLAEKPDHAGKGKGKSEKGQYAEKGDKGDKHDKHGGGGKYFDDRQRVVINNYYGPQIQAGRCPPGLAKKNNGCMPPGQAKKWQLGRPLPADVVWYEVPRQVVIDLGPPPPRHRYVRVASDILLIAIGTGMVMDAIEDLGRM